MRYVEIYSRGRRRVAEIRVTKKWVTLFHLPSLQTIKVRHAEYKEILLGEVEADWRYLKRELKKRVALYNLKGKRYAKEPVKKILEEGKDEQVPSGD